MLALSDAFKKVLFANQVLNPFAKLVFEDTADEPDHGLMSFDLDVSQFINAWGNVKRSMSYDIGKFSPGGHSFELSNNKTDIGDWLFTLRKKFGSDFWMDKEYYILWGFKQIPVTTSISVTLPVISPLGFGDEPTDIIATPATLGWGVPPSGTESLTSAREETVEIYRGDIYTKTEQRMAGIVNVGSKDITKRINDFKVCTLILASEIFDYGTSTDYNDVGYQQVIKYGIHKLITNSEGKEISERKNPFSITLGNPNLANAIIIGSGDSIVPSYYLWYFPFINDIDVSAVNYSGGTYKVYYWDYRSGQKKWTPFDSTNFNSKVEVTKISGIDGIFVKILTSIPDGFTGTWSDYKSGASAWADDNPDPMICIETKSNTYINGTYNPNPVLIIYDLLTNSRFIGFDSGMLDISSPQRGVFDGVIGSIFLQLQTPVEGYSFDETFNFFNGEDAEINTDYNKEIGLLRIVEDIAKICGMYFFTEKKKSISEDRRIHLLYNRTVSPCTDDPPALLSLSTAGKLQSYQVNTNSDDLKDKVIITNFDSGISTPDNFDVKIQGTGNRVLQLSAPTNPPVYFYNSGAAADSIAQRLLSQLNKPPEIINTDLDASGLVVELGDYVKLHEHKINETIIAQIFNSGFAVNGTGTGLVAKRYTDLYGPEESNPFKKWAFVGCAYVDDDQIGGNGADASIELNGTVVTLASGETIDSNIAIPGMAITLDGDNATFEHFRLKQILTTITFEIEESLEGGGDIASIAHANVTWSIGNSYHVY